MLFQKATVNNGQVTITESKVVDQSKLTSDCFLIQIEGIKACENCEFKDTKDCGGMKIRKRLARTTTPVKFKWLSGDINWIDFGGKWISNKLNNGEFDYWMVLELSNMYNSCGKQEAERIGGKYLVSLDAVSPSQVGEEALKKGLSSWGMEDKPLSEIDDEMKVEILCSYGTAARLWYNIGSNANKLLKEGRKQAQEENKGNINSSLNSFANAMGHTKMDMLKGDFSFKTAMKNKEALSV
jgi:hypothetical protein